MQQRGKVLLVAALALVLITALAAVAQADDYSNHWSAQYINGASNRGWMTGDGNGNFRPEAAITRGEFAVMLWRALGQPPPKFDCTFNDVARGAFYYQAVAALFEAKVVNGLDSATFGPNVTLTREMGCTMLARAYNLAATNVNAYQQFADAADVSAWAREAVSALLERNYIAGVGENRVAPKQQLKRGEMAKLLITVFDGMQVITETLRQDAVAAISSYLSGPTLTVKQTVQGSDAVLVTVTATDSMDREVTFIGWRESEQDAKYSSKSSFTANDITSKKEFTLKKNGWYAVYAENKDGHGSFKLFEVTTIRENSPKVELTQETLASGEVRITVDVTPAGSRANDEIKSVRYRSNVREGSTYSSSSGFGNDVSGFNYTTNTGTFMVDPGKDYGWYAVCAVDKNDEFGYSLIEIKKPSTTCTVTFNADGGTPAPVKQTVDYNTKATKPADPGKTGYFFDGWYKDGKPWDFDDRVTEDMTLKAQWRPVGSPAITTTTLPNGTAGTLYSEALSATGDTPITWSSSNLPAWLNIDPVTGVISGTPTADGTFNFTVKAENAKGSSTKALSIEIAAAAPVTYTITVSVGPVAGGSVTGTDVYEAGESVTVTATAEAGYVFVEWQEGDSQVSVNASYTFTASANRTLVAIFEDE
jgi:uncharacterized repeat protein (TIGR02543 family)